MNSTRWGRSSSLRSRRRTPLLRFGGFGPFELAWVQRRRRREWASRRSLVGGLGLGAGFGAGLMYLFDPRSGRRRRARLRDQAVHLAHVMGNAADDTAHDLANRPRGLIAELTAMFERGEVDDAVLVERVRAKLGRTVSHPRSIAVSAERGRIVLGGPILGDEVDRLLARVASVRGVKAIENRLEVHAQAGDVPGRQGAARPERPDRFELAQTYWSPAARLLALITGGGLLTSAIARRDLLGAALGTAVAALFGADPKSARDADLVRLKSLLELGKTTAHGETVTREALARAHRPR